MACVEAFSLLLSISSWLAASFSRLFRHRPTTTMTITVDLSLAQSMRKGYDARLIGEIVKAVIKSNRIVCLTGAGISTSAGIPVRYP